MRTILLALPLTLLPMTALAEDFRIGGEFGLFHDSIGDSSITLLTEVIDADITLFDTVALTGGVPFVQLIGSFGGDTEARFRIANPYVAAYYQLSTDLLRLRIGAGISIPAAQVPDDDEGFIALAMYGGAYAMHGLLTPWMWTPESLPIRIPSLDMRLDLGLVTIDAGGDIVLLVNISDSGGLLDGGDDVEVTIPLHAGAMVNVWFLGFGGDLGLATFPTTEDGDLKAQVSLSPRITAEFGPLELEARLTMNLDHPFGFAFDDGGFWGFFLGAHAVF